jgi:hypothetical protein
MESSIRPSFLRKNRRTRKGLFTANHEWPVFSLNIHMTVHQLCQVGVVGFTCQPPLLRGIPEHSPVNLG